MQQVHFYEPCEVVVSENAYPNGQTRLDLITQDGELMATATVALDGVSGKRGPDQIVRRK